MRRPNNESGLSYIQILGRTILGLTLGLGGAVALTQPAYAETEQRPCTEHRIQRNAHQRIIVFKTMMPYLG